jgi:dienelactone hydrolase
MTRLSILLLPGVLVFVLAAAPEAAYTELFYPSGGLRIQAYLYQPDGAGPFPVVIYNHGSRVGRERASVPNEFIGNMLTRAGYVVLIPERRGYGKSEGPIWRPRTKGYETSDDRQLVSRLEEETDDVLAALDYLRALPFVDMNRLGIMGWSFGGIVTMFAVGRSTAFAAAVDQAGGALVWHGSAQMRQALIAAAERSTTPTLLLVAQNDRTTASITTLAEIFKKRGVAHRLVIYEPFKSAREGIASAPGHRIFSAEGADIWEGDVLEFLSRYLGPDSKSGRVR